MEEIERSKKWEDDYDTLTRQGVWPLPSQVLLKAINNLCIWHPIILLWYKFSIATIFNSSYQYIISIYKHIAYQSILPIIFSDWNLPALYWRVCAWGNEGFWAGQWKSTHRFTHREQQKKRWPDWCFLTTYYHYKIYQYPY